MSEQKSDDDVQETANDDVSISNSSSLRSESSDAKKPRLQTPSPSPESPRAGPFTGIPASPPKFISLDEIMAAAAGVKNMALAHEIAVNSEFKIEKPEKPSNSIEKKVTEIMHKAFWDAFQEKINEDPPDFSHSIVLIGEVKENLISLLLPQHVRLKTQINEVLDLELIQQQMVNKTFDIFYYSNYVIGIMARLCAPARDEQIEKLRAIKEIVPLFKEIFAVLDAMKMDMANFTIQQIRPYLQQQSVEFERQKFQEFLTMQQVNGIDGLELTKAWLKRAYENLEDSLPNDDAQGKTPASILNEAFMELLVWDERRLFPETLVMDQARFLEVKHKASQAAMTASVLLVTYGTVGSAITGVQTLKEKLKSEILTLMGSPESSEFSEEQMTSVGLQVNTRVNEYLQEHGFNPRTQEQQTSLQGQIKDLYKQDHPVFSLMTHRLRDFLHQVISRRHTEPVKLPPGFSVVEQEMASICGQFTRLVSHNRSVFFEYYNDIIHNLMSWKPTDLSPRDPHPDNVK